MCETRIEMDVFMQSDSNRCKLDEENEGKLYLLQVKVDKVNKEILDFPILRQTIASLQNQNYQNEKNLTQMNSKVVNLTSKIEEYKTALFNFSTKIQNLDADLLAYYTLTVNLDASNKNSNKNFENHKITLKNIETKLNNLTNDVTNHKNNLNKIEKQIISPEILFANEAFSKQYMQQINQSIKNNNEIKKINEVEKKYETLKKYTEEKVAAFNIEIAKLSSTKKKQS